MNVGTAIRYERESRTPKVGRAELARRAKISVGYLKKIEKGERNARIAVLSRIAAALAIELKDLLAETQTDIPGADSKRSRLPSTEPSPHTSIADFKERAPYNPDSSPEYWIGKGDAAAARGQSDKALQCYEEAEQLLAHRKDYTWARLVVERLGQMLINLDDFKRLSRELSRVEQEYQRPFELKYGRSDDRIQMLLDEKREWQATWEGDTQAAVLLGETAYRTARELGDEGRVARTALHFVGRSICESLTTMMLYERLYPKLRFSSHHERLLQQAAIRLAAAGRMEHDAGNPFAEAFNAQWEARTRRALRQLDRAKDLQNLWQRTFGPAEAAESTLDLVKFTLIDEDPQLALTEAKGMLERILEAFRDIRYAPGLAEALTTEAYLRFCRGDYRVSAPNRQRGADYAVASILLHLYPQHPNYRVAYRLLEQFVWEMGDKEFRNFDDTIQARITEGLAPGVFTGDRPFELLTSAFFLPEDVIDRAHRLLHQARYRHDEPRPIVGIPLSQPQGHPEHGLFLPAQSP